MFHAAEITKTSDGNQAQKFRRANSLPYCGKSFMLAGRSQNRQLILKLALATPCPRQSAGWI
jgi:hypothetical protein